MAILGQTIAGIHIGLMLVNATAIVLLFLLARRLFDNIAAIVAAASYALLSLSPSVLGTSAHATQFIVPLALSGNSAFIAGSRFRQSPVPVYKRCLLWSGISDQAARNLLCRFCADLFRVGHNQKNPV